MHPLDSANLKVKWAKKHIHSLNISISRTTSNPNFALHRKGRLNIPNSIEGVRVENPDIVALNIEPAIRKNWSFLIGDILSNLRASLDHIAWALAMQKCKEDGSSLKESKEKMVKFPIKLIAADTPYREGVGLLQSDVKFFPERAWDTIDYFQPYNRRYRPKTEFLGVVNQLVNIDKHRIITPVFRQVSFRLASNDQFMRARLNQPNEFLFLVDNSKRNTLKPEVNFEVVLNVPFLFPNTFPVSDFSLIHNFIRDEVIPAFEKFF